MPKMPSKQSSPSGSSTEARLRKHALAIFHAALAAADPYEATLAHLRPLPKSVQNLYVIGAGKAAAAMARAAEKFYGKKIRSGVIVTKYGHAQPLKKIRCLEAAHPVPDLQASMRRRRSLKFAKMRRRMIWCSV